MVKLKWLDRMSERNKLLALSFVVGVAAGLAGVVLNLAINWIGSGLSNAFGWGSYRWSYLVLPGVGMFISLLMLIFIVKDNIGHGVTQVLLAVSRNDSKIKPHNMWSSVVTSAITIGFGGSVGSEAPIVYTGAAIGSNVGRVFGLSYRNITTLLGCGAAAAIAAVFKAPLAGVIFTMEILFFNISMNSMLPLLIATVSATVVSYAFLGQNPEFTCTLTPFVMGNIPFYVVMGIVCGFCSLYFTNMTLWLEDKLGKLHNRYVKWILCAVGLGLLIFLFPPLYGAGYDSLQMLLDGKDAALTGTSILRGLMQSAWGVPLFFLLVFVFKVIAMTFTNAGGGVGGTFGPTLFEGAILGFVLARGFNLLGADVPEQNFVLVGMAALMAGVMQAPLTAIFLIAEISGGYGLFIPLILTSTIAYGTVRIFDKYSIYTKRIAKSGDLMTHDNDQAVMMLLKTRDLIRDKYPHILDTATFREVVKTTTQSTAAVFPVLDDKGRFQGLIDMDNFRKYLVRPQRYAKLNACNVMEQPVEYVYADEKIESVMAKFDRTEAWRLPVIEQDRTYLGFISKSRILMAYRSELKEISLGDE